jgi:hypothetical protein
MTENTVLLIQSMIAHTITTQQAYIRIAGATPIFVASFIAGTYINSRIGQNSVSKYVHKTPLEIHLIRLKQISLFAPIKTANNAIIVYAPALLFV